MNCMSSSQEFISPWVHAVFLPLFQNGHYITEILCRFCLVGIVYWTMANSTLFNDTCINVNHKIILHIIPSAMMVCMVEYSRNEIGNGIASLPSDIYFLAISVVGLHFEVLQYSRLFVRLRVHNCERGNRTAVDPVRRVTCLEFALGLLISGPTGII